MNRRSFIGTAGSIYLLANNRPQANNLGRPESPEFIIEAFELRTINESDLPFTEDLQQTLGVGGHFVDGVKRYVLRDVVYDHPLTVSQYVMRLLHNYGTFGDSIYLEHAELNLDHISELEDVIEDRGFYPYEFDWSIPSEPDDKLSAPWVSGMTQGQVLQAYNRHRRVTGSNRYAEVSSRALESFSPVDDASAYWSPTTDSSGYLWLEEYPSTPPSETLNGHIFAIYGLYESWLMNPDPWVESLIQGAITTVKNRVHEYQREGQPSRYWTITEKYADRYHVIHIAQMLQLYRMTGDVAFAQVADTFWKDYPPYSFSCRFYLEPGSYDAFNYSSDKPSIIFGEPESIQLEKLTLVQASQRRRMPENDEFWYLCTTAPFSNMWIKENSAAGIVSDGEYVGTKSIAGPLHGSRMIYTPPRTGKAGTKINDGYATIGMDATFPSVPIAIERDTDLIIVARELISTKDYTLVETEGRRFWVASDLIEYDA